MTWQISSGVVVGEYSLDYPTYPYDNKVSPQSFPLHDSDAFPFLLLKFESYYVDGPSEHAHICRFVVEQAPTGDMKAQLQTLLLAQQKVSSPLILSTPITVHLLHTTPAHHITHRMLRGLQTHRTNHGGLTLPATLVMVYVQTFGMIGDQAGTGGRGGFFWSFKVRRHSTK